MNDANEASIGRLIDRERIRGASRAIAEGTDAKSVTDEQIQQVADDVRTFCRAQKPDIKVNQLATATGYSSPTISEFLNGKYAGNRGQVAIDLENWLVGEEHRRSQPQTTQFVWTNVAMKIKSVANLCRDYKKIAMIYGPDASGVGKTMALRAIAQELGPRQATLITIDKVDANPTGLLCKICQGIRVTDNGRSRDRFERIVNHLRGRSHLLMIDQIHNLRGAKDDKPLYILTDLQDATNTSQLWCGTADMVGYLRKQQIRGDESLAQIRRRIFPCIDLMEGVREGGNGEPLVSVENIREMFAKNKLKITSAAAKFLCMLCNTPDSGAVGLCVQLIEYVTAIGINLTIIDVPVLKHAMSLGMTTARAELLLRHIADAPERMAKVG